MGTNTLTTIVGPGIDAADFNQLKTALSGPFVPRNSSGVPTDLAGDFGTATYPFKKIYGDELFVSSVENPTEIYLKTGNDVISGLSTSSGQPAYLDPAGSGAGRSVTIRATSVDLSLVIGASDVILTADISVSSLTAAPSSNNTATVNDADAAGGYQERTWGEYGGEKEFITVTSMGSEITALVGTFQAFLLGTECFIAFVESTTKLSKIFRGYFYDAGQSPINRVTFSNSATITLLSACWIFAKSDGTAAFTVTNPAWSADEPGAPSTGDFWLDTVAGVWKIYNGAAFVDSSSTYLGIAVCDSTDCLFARSEDFAAIHRPANSVTLEIENDTTVRVDNDDASVCIAGFDVTPGFDLIRWDISAGIVATPASYSTSEANSTDYFCYLTPYGDPIVSDIEPTYCRTFLGWYHPQNPWRCVGKFFNNSSGNISFISDIPTDFENCRSIIYQAEDSAGFAMSTSYAAFPQTTAVAPSVTDGIFHAGSGVFNFRFRGWVFLGACVEFEHGAGSTEVVTKRFQNTTAGTTLGNLGTHQGDTVDGVPAEMATVCAFAYIADLAASYRFELAASANAPVAFYSQTSIRRVKGNLL